MEDFVNITKIVMKCFINGWYKWFYRNGSGIFWMYIKFQSNKKNYNKQIALNKLSHTEGDKILLNTVWLRSSVQNQTIDDFSIN